MRNRALALTALCALAFCGCINVSVTVGEEISEERVKAIVPGQTTKQEILSWFGAPAEHPDIDVIAALLDAGEVTQGDIVGLPYSDLLVYDIVDGDAHVLLLIAVNFMRVDVMRDRLVVFFDDHEVVKSYGISRQRGKPLFFAPDHTGQHLDPATQPPSSP